MKKHHRTIRIIYFTVLILGSFLVGVMISAFNLEGTIRQVVYWGWIAIRFRHPQFSVAKKAF